MVLFIRELGNHVWTLIYESLLVGWLHTEIDTVKDVWCKKIIDLGSNPNFNSFMSPNFFRQTSLVQKTDVISSKQNWFQRQLSWFYYNFHLFQKFETTNFKIFFYNTLAWSFLFHEGGTREPFGHGHHQNC